ncbi:MAG: hypothetical protein E8D40_15170 [Nitrospira sp.]|nr:MAG: hypothetical protein E8D40_15170 [Nitrospira sp.]
MAQVASTTRLPRGWFAVGVVCVALLHEHVGIAKDLLPPKAQESTEIGSTQSPSFDHQEKDIPQSLFTWIKMAKGFEIEWDTFGRKGWYTQDPRLKPIGLGSTFTPEIQAIYIVFEVAPLEDPAQFAVQWQLEKMSGQLNEKPLGKDVLEVSGHERYGYLELKRSGEKWPLGNYLAKIYIAPIGQQPFHAVNHVGVMRFTIADTVPTWSPEQKSVR